MWCDGKYLLLCCVSTANMERKPIVMDHGPDDSESETDENQIGAESDGDQSDHEPDINDSENETDENQIDAENKRRSFTKEFQPNVCCELLL